MREVSFDLERAQVPVQASAYLCVGRIVHCDRLHKFSRLRTTVQATSTDQGQLRVTLGTKLAADAAAKSYPTTKAGTLAEGS